MLKTVKSSSTRRNVDNPYSIIQQLVYYNCWKSTHLLSPAALALVLLSASSLGSRTTLVALLVVSRFELADLVSQMEQYGITCGMKKSQSSRSANHICYTSSVLRVGKAGFTGVPSSFFSWILTLPLCSSSLLPSLE